MPTFLIVILCIVGALMYVHGSWCSSHLSALGAGMALWYGAWALVRWLA